MSLDTVRISKKGRDQLITLNRHTGIRNWNVTCRWAFCISIAEATPPKAQRIGGEAAIEMTWHTFGGEHQEVYLALLKERCKRDGIAPTDENLAAQLRLHLHRGISYLAGDKAERSIDDLIRRALDSKALANEG